jgi:GNAT superfamily N-acetyltransferase
MMKTNSDILLRNAEPSEYAEIGQLMVDVYSRLDGFPQETEQPDYYKMLRNVGALTNKPETEIIVAVTPDNQILGAVVNFSDMQYYGSGGTATKEKNSGGFRLLAVDPKARKQGVGRLLTLECIKRAKDKNLRQVIIHTTMAMRIAWKMYESIGFKRSEDLDFMQGDLPVFGFRFRIT